MGVGHGHLDVLHHRDLDVLDGLLAVVADGDGGRDLLPVVVQFPVERHLHVQLAGGEGEALGGHRGGLAQELVGGGVLDLPHRQGHGVAAVGFLLCVVGHEHP